MYLECTVGLQVWAAPDPSTRGAGTHAARLRTKAPPLHPTPLARACPAHPLLVVFGSRLRRRHAWHHRRRHLVRRGRRARRAAARAGQLACPQARQGAGQQRRRAAVAGGAPP